RRSRHRPRTKRHAIPADAPRRRRRTPAGGSQWEDPCSWRAADDPAQRGGVASRPARYDSDEARPPRIEVALVERPCDARPAFAERVLAAMPRAEPSFRDYRRLTVVEIFIARVVAMLSGAAPNLAQPRVRSDRSLADEPARQRRGRVVLRGNVHPIDHEKAVTSEQAARLRDCHPPVVVGEAMRERV